MKKLMMALIFTLFLPLFCGQAFAEAEPPTVSVETKGIEKDLPEEARDILGGLEVEDDGQMGLDAIIETFKEDGFGIFKVALRSGVMIITIVLLCAFAGSAMEDGAPKETVNMCGAIAVSAVAVSNVSSFIGLGISALHSLSDFSKALLPTLCAASVSAGAITSATAKFAATAMFMDVLITLGTTVIMPLITAYLAVLIAGSVLGKETVSRVANILKWVCTTALILLVMAFTAYLGITGIISGATDTAAAKLTKTAVGVVLPVVGGIIGDAAGTLVAGAGILRNSIGIFGLLGVAAVCLIPFLKLGAHYLVYKGTAALSEALTDKRMAELIGGVGTAFGLVLGLVGSAGMMMFISIISSMRAVTGV